MNKAQSTSKCFTTSDFILRRMFQNKMKITISHNIHTLKVWEAFTRKNRKAVFGFFPGKKRKLYQTSLKGGGRGYPGNGVTSQTQIWQPIPGWGIQPSQNNNIQPA